MASRAPFRARSRTGLDIRRARLAGARSGDRDRLALQLAPVRPADAGIAERAILLVPRLKAKAPFVRDSSRGEFAEAVVAGLRQALRRARRPWDSYGADDPLLFEDEAEAAAGLIHAFLAGARERSWWPSLTGGLDPPSWIRRTVLCDPFLLPRVVDRLAASDLEAWIGRLEDQETERAFALLADAYGLVAPPVQSGIGPAAAAGEARDVARVVEVASRLRVEPRARRLVALALLARHRPALVATPAASAVILGLGKVLADSGEAAEPPEQPAPSIPSALAPPRQRVPRSGYASKDTPAGGPERSANSPAPAALFALEPEEEGEAIAVPSSSSAIEHSRRTCFGGLLFLLNALTALRVCADFTNPQDGMVRGSPFALIDRLGLMWLGDAYASDPLHALLKELLNSSGGSELLLPGRWSAPRWWLEPWGKRRASIARERFGASVLWHPAGFPLAELAPREARALLGARKAPPREERRLRALERRLPRDPRLRWLVCLALYLEARLELTLGSKAALAILCNQPARIEADEERLVARFELAEHPLPIRFAGLDRNPGWIPASGRIVEFAFE